MCLGLGNEITPHLLDQLLAWRTQRTASMCYSSDTQVNQLVFVQYTDSDRLYSRCDHLPLFLLFFSFLFYFIQSRRIFQKDSLLVKEVEHYKRKHEGRRNTHHTLTKVLVRSGWWQHQKIKWKNVFDLLRDLAVLAFFTLKRQSMHCNDLPMAWSLFADIIIKMSPVLFFFFLSFWKQ